MSLARVSLFKFSLLMIAALGMTSCTSYFVRQDCNKVDWFKHGQSVALEGRRLTGDPLITKCEAVEADVSHSALDKGFKVGMETYCQPDTVYQIGRRGDPFNPSMCDGERPRFLQTKHTEGVRAYCAKSNGYAAGVLGRPYNNICPANLEGAFIPEFNRGRKSYLVSQVNQNENAISALESDLRRLERDRSSLQYSLSSMGSTKVLTKVSTYDPNTRTHREESRWEEDQEAKRRRSDLEWKVQDLNRQIESKRQEQDRLRTTNRQMNAEIATLN